MKFRSMTNFIILFYLCSTFLFSANQAIKPVTPKASPEARALLKLLVDISGKYTLTGQHNYPNTKGKNSEFAAKYIGKTPAVWSTDMGFAEDGDTDSYLARPNIVKEAIQHHQQGAIITICWHAVPPTWDEPVTFRPVDGVGSSDSLASVQGQLLDRQFQDVLTPGTKLYNRWCAQVDSVANYLKKLQKAKVPILWRPYHEMNGDWFWWGGRHGKYSTRALYKQLFDRYVKHHKLNNLIWVWSVDRPNKPEMHFSHYFPGKDYLDVVALDVYGSDFSQTYYDSLMLLADGKPLVLGEVGNPPKLEILDNQPNWTLYATWAGMVRNTLKKEYKILMSDPRILNQEDPAYHEIMAPYRAACKLPVLPIESKHKKVDFSGNWAFNEDKSILNQWGVGRLPYKMGITQTENELAIQKTFIVEWGDDRVTEENLTLDGTEMKSEMWNSPRIMTAKWTENGDSLIIESKITFNWGGQASEMILNETWTLQEDDVISITQFSSSRRGDREIIMIYNKQ
ncbi:glycosyl hydrolase [bacterium]